MPRMDAPGPQDLPLRRRYLGRRHGLANCAYLLAMHAGLLAWLCWGRELLPYPVFIVVSVAFCLVHQRILSEWFHEATHWNLVPGRRWNDALADLLIGTFNGTRVRNNRAGHFRHHAVTVYFTADDPDTRGSAAASRGELVRGLLRDLSGASALTTFLAAARGGEGRNLPAALAWLGALLLLHGALLVWSVLAGRADIYPIYFVTLLTLYPIANRFRLYAQHASLETDGSYKLNGSGASRTFHASLVEQVLLHSPMIMYHNEHHAAPNLPYRALRARSRSGTDANAFGRNGIRFARTVVIRLPR